MSYKLTICVPAKPDSPPCIDEVMENLLLQTTGSEVEVLLLDCGLKEAESRSWKNTQRSNWRYIRCAEDATADELLRKCVHIAEGDYCWIFNGYDVLANGAVQRVLAELRNGYTLVLLNSILCDTWLRPLRREYALKESIGDQIFNFRNESDMVAYLEHATSLVAAFAYPCGVVFSTESIRLKIRETHDFPDGAAFMVAVFALLREEAGTSLSYVQRALIYDRLTLVTEQSGKLRESIASDFSRYSYIAEKELAGWPKAASALIHYALRGSHPWAWSELCAGANGWGNFREELARIIDFEGYHAAREIDAQSAAQGYSFYEIGSVSRLQVHDRRQAAVFMDGEVDDLTIVSIRHEKVRIHRVLEMSCVDFLLVRPSKKAVFNLIAVLVDGSGTVYYPATVECWHNKVLSMLSGWVQKELERLGHNELVLDEGQTALPLNIRELQQGRAIPCLSDYLTIVHHIKRYRFSADHLLPGRVLDCACGVGYGASIMLRNENLTEYIGVDLDKDALIFSEWNVQDPRASFQQGDISELDIGKFENIVSLETLEHVKDPDGFLAALAANLRPDGRLILSVPAERWAGTHLYPYHVTNWTYRRFSSLVERHFEECVIYRQKLSLLGPDTFSASEIVSGPHYADEDEDFIAILGRPRTRNKRRIFVRRRYALGDVVLTTPIIRALRNQYPDAVILLAADVAQVYQNNPNVDVVGNMQLEPRSTDILIDLDGCYERLRSRNIVHAYAAAAGVQIGDWRSEVFPADSDRAVVIAALRQRGWANTGISYLIGVHMAASSPDRVWPAGYWKEWFARALDAEAIAVVVVGSDRDFDVDTLKLTREQSARVLSLVGQTSVQTSAAALSLCDLVVAPDSGMTHLANAVGVRTLVLFGMADPDTRLPLDGGGTGIWSPVECRGCLKRLGPEADPRCRYGAAFCMEAIAVDAVWSATEAALSSAQADSWRVRAGLPSCRRGGRASAMIEDPSPEHKGFNTGGRAVSPSTIFSFQKMFGARGSLMDRHEALLEFVCKKQRGIEIGPYFTPLTPKSEGWNVLALDIFSAAILRKRANEDPNIPSEAIQRIEEVDLLGSATQMGELVAERGESGQLDFILSSHNFEHLPNPIKFLRDCSIVLHAGGIVSMAIPDKRACFDYFRPLSTLSGILEAYAENRDRPTRAQLLEAETLQAEYIGDNVKLTSFELGLDPNKIVPKQNVVEAHTEWKARCVVPKEEYEDCHCWVFTPCSFLLLLLDLRFLGYVDLELVRIHETRGNEFIVHLRNTRGTNASPVPSSIDPVAYYKERRALLHAVHWETSIHRVPGGAAGTPSNLAAAFSPATGTADPRPVFSYRQWCNIFGLHESDGQVMAERMMQQWHHQPAIHMIAMLRRGEGAHLAATLDSLSTQLYAGWGLTVLAEEPCPDPRFAQIQNVEWCESGGDRAAALNAIVGESESDWVGLLRPGDRLAQHALFACADRVQIADLARLLYTDWDRLDEAGDRWDPRFERDVDVDWLRTGECLGGLWLIRRDALLELGGFADRGPEEARDLALRVFERFGTDAFGHVDEVLCHRPASSRAEEEGADTGSHRAVLSAHLRRMGESGEILDGLVPRALRVRYPVQREPVVSVIVDTVDDLRVLERFIDTLRETTEYRNLELVVVDCGSRDEDTEEYFDTLRANGAVVVSVPEGAGRAEAWNAGACAARGEFLIFADRRAGFVQKDWLETLLGHAQRKGVGIVAPRIVGADGTVVHSALVLGFDGPAKDAFRGLSALDPGYGGRALTEQGCSAVPPACLLVSRACFEEVGGFDAERFSSDWFSVDFCLRSEAAGHHTIWTPYALVGWQAHEPARETGDPEQAAAVYERWLPRLARDSFYHRNLDLSGAVFRPRMEATARWNPAFHERPRILGVPADTFGCGEYRILAPLNALDGAARAHCGVLAPQEGSPRMPSVTELARLAPDTLLLQSALYDVHLEALHRYRRFNQVFRVFDMEDLKTNVPEKNSRRSFLFRNIKARTRQALSLCDRLIVTTEPLADAYRGLIGDIRVVPVYLARERWGSVTAARNEGSRPRVGWAGGQQHEGDLEILLPIVQATAGEVDWVFLGMCPEVLRPYVKEVHDMVPFAEYPARLGSLALNLTIAPLEEHPFNVAKTNLRLLEYGVLGWPVVCTDIEPYRGAPVMRVPNDPVRWIKAIRERVNDLDAARAEGARLREWVLGGWMLEDHLDEWLEALSPSEGTGAVVVGQP